MNAHQIDPAPILAAIEAWNKAYDDNRLCTPVGLVQADRGLLSAVTTLAFKFELPVLLAAIGLAFEQSHADDLHEACKDSN